MKLRTKIQLFTSLFMLVLVLLVNTSIYFLFYKIAADSDLEQMAVQMDALTETLADNPDISNEEAKRLIKAYLPTNGMIRVIDENDRPFILQTKSGAYETLPWEYVTTESKTIETQANGPDVAIITRPVIWNNGEIVTVQLSNNLNHLEETMKTLFYVLIVAGAIMLIPSIIAGTLLGRFLLNPIQKLIQTMKDNTKHAKWQKINLENRSKDELYEMEMTFNEMIDYLRDNFEKQEIFVSNASHELKTPIQIVKSYAQLLERRGMENPELLQESIEAIDSEADRMKKLVEQLLSLAKNRQAQEMNRVDLGELTEETVETFERAYARKINFQQNADDLMVYGNRDQLEQVIYILIENAIKYSNDKINVSASKLNDDVIIQVKDHGQGIHEDEQKRIFDRFYRVDKARSRETGGTGLGLAIAKVITEEHHGEVSVSSKVGEGSTFTLCLPYRE
ncbi:HAMP domain-containing sensor histidine kinase [Oceanobacillus profundus]|uniref:Signal transduction histidine-protein kinase ArlS n=1 Tax=Oceanobacillus profundus TaxID=372463 RepID=A0A417YE94_9BACI|nr:HAMP domain-containing histidine kinase [Oceanobacillus profundus]PAE28378.1 two-component sensor histidine kinase [Paenibacillus sp. 7884-2]RHW30983.1 sensor histidine kinase [Oceanobacillus profundus]